MFNFGFPRQICHPWTVLFDLKDSSTLFVNPFSLFSPISIRFCTFPVNVELFEVWRRFLYAI